ncbi:asparagine synthase-related protein [Sediminibacterium ginsengisoli]|uniref:asparagine synthase (glutamine-hydrolyzing) n=1 Tax=Sediminibacterium ginsengisoli TaxID=413434 RepID=A0A1T4L696_9BACT|nr:asparagine synthase-related protein [Sediminibacterium ginsengisoli]SJZ50107.1 asparagine synthase (glutamine-hydrolysing) [Sediminibacterium ginsengisoli]
MSTIFGKCNIDKQPVLTDEAVLMKVALDHWNADASGIWADEQTMLGQLTLFNTPESFHEKLPFTDAVSGMTIVADARIDNREELFRKLGVMQDERPQLADSILILKAYCKYGEECLSHFVGDFTFAIWDPSEQKLFCVRDHVGIKPLFYYSDDHFFAFASEKKGLLAIPGIKQKANHDYLMKMVGFIDHNEAETSYEGISRLPPGHFVSIQGKCLKLTKYWELDTEQEIIYKDPRDYVHAFKELFDEAIKCRLRSAFTVGAELSGGLDSSGITCIAARMLHEEGKKIATFSYGFDEKSKTFYHNTEDLIEEHFADEVIAFANVDKVIKIREDGYSNFMEEIDLALRINDGPGVLLPWHDPLKKKVVEENVRVLLSGFPGDQMVTSYAEGYFFEHFEKKRYRTFLKEAKREMGAMKALALLFKATADCYLEKSLTAYRKKRFIQNHRNLPGNFLTPTLSHAEYQRLVKDPPGWPRSYRRLQKMSLQKILVSNRPETEDRNSLLYKSETRFPMADRRLLQFMLSIPAGQKANATGGRLLYRKSMAAVIPESIIRRTDKESLIHPFVLPNWIRDQGSIAAWLKQAGLPERLPYVNFDKLMAGYSLDNDRDYFILNGRMNRKRLHCIVRWLEKNNL